jgi:hypothetical protein
MRVLSPFLVIAANVFGACWRLTELRTWELLTRACQHHLLNLASRIVSITQMSSSYVVGDCICLADSASQSLHPKLIVA